MRAVPPPQGLYDGQHEHDACGVAFVATLTGEASHDIVPRPSLRCATSSTVAHPAPNLTPETAPAS